MFKYLKEYRFYIILFVFILIPILAFDTSSRAPRQIQWHDKMILAIATPAQWGLTWVLDTSVSFFENTLFLLQTRKQNKELLVENRKLLKSISNLEETQNENIRLRRLLNFQERQNLKTVAAKVIARDISSEFRMIRINRGEEFGIQKDMAVLTEEGVVGRVLRTTKTTADIVTLHDLLFAIDAIISRSRAKGIVEGLSEDLCQLRFSLRTDDIELGDKIITSGMGGVFPKGIPIGVVTQIKKQPFGITQDIEVKPAVDFSKLEEVLVVKEFNTEAIKEKMESHETPHP